MTPQRDRDNLVPRPLKKAEYEIVFITRQAEKGWRDGLATFRNAIVDAWDHLCQHPTHEDGRRVYRLQSGLATGTYDGVSYERYQYKFPNGGRIWYFVAAPADKKGKVAGRVLIEDVHTSHPNETK